MKKLIVTLKRFIIAHFITAILISLKLTGVIKWGWVWVTALFWIPIFILLLITIVSFIINYIYFKIAQNKQAIRKKDHEDKLNKIWDNLNNKRY